MRYSTLIYVFVLLGWIAAIFLPALLLRHFNHVLMQDPHSSEAESYFRIVHGLGWTGFIGCMIVYLAAVWGVLVLVGRALMARIR
jgi:hypothetical protein